MTDSRLCTLRGSVIKHKSTNTVISGSPFPIHSLPLFTTYHNFPLGNSQRATVSRVNSGFPLPPNYIFMLSLPQLSSGNDQRRLLKWRRRPRRKWRVLAQMMSLTMSSHEPGSTVQNQSLLVKCKTTTNRLRPIKMMISLRPSSVRAYCYPR